MSAITHADLADKTKYENIINILRSMCMNATCRYSHVACIVKGKKLVSYSRNDYSRQCFNGKYISSLHAEIACMRNIPDLRKGMKVIVLRYSKGTGKLCDSRPCNTCKEYLTSKGLTSIYCSNEDGHVVKYRIKDLPVYNTKAQVKVRDIQEI
jgi:deoxycytidylate deaminase